MWLNQLFTDHSIDFERRCRMRIKVGLGIVFLGIFSMAIPAFKGNILYSEAGAQSSISGIYEGLGIGLILGGVVSILKNVKYLKYPDLRRKREVYETDERNRLLGLRCWAYAGYSMFLALYAGMIISGFISITVLKTLLAVTAVYGFLLLAFRIMLNKSM